MNITPWTRVLPPHLGQEAARDRLDGLAERGYPLVRGQPGYARFVVSPGPIDPLVLDDGTTHHPLWTPDRFPSQKSVGDLFQAIERVALEDPTHTDLSRELPFLIPHWDQAGFWSEDLVFQLLDASAREFLRDSPAHSIMRLTPAAIGEIYRLSLDFRFHEETLVRYLEHLQNTPLHWGHATLAINTMGLLALQGYSFQRALEVFESLLKRFPLPELPAEILPLLRQCAERGPVPEGVNLYEELMKIHFQTGEKRRILFGKRDFAFNKRVGDILVRLALPLQLKEREHRVALDTDFDDNLHTRRWREILEIFGFDQTSLQEALKGQDRWDLGIDSRFALLDRTLFTWTSNTVPYDRIGRMPWFGPKPFEGRFLVQPSGSYLDDEATAFFLTGHFLPGRRPSPPQDRPIIFINPYRFEGLTPLHGSPSPVLFWKTLVGALAAAIPGAFFFVSGSEQGGEDGLFAALELEIGAERVFSLGFPNLRTLRGLYQHPNALAVIGPDTGTVQHLGATTSIRSYFLAGPRFSAQLSLANWTPTTGRVVPFVTDGSRPREIGETIARHLQDPSPRVEMPWLRQRLISLRKKIENSMVTEAFAEELMLLVEEALLADPKDPLLPWHALHAMKWVYILLLDEKPVWEEIGQRLAQNPLTLPLLARLDEVEGYLEVGAVVHHEILYGPFLGEMIRRAGWHHSTFFHQDTTEI